MIISAGPKYNVNEEKIMATEGNLSALNRLMNYFISIGWVLIFYINKNKYDRSTVHDCYTHNTVSVNFFL